MSSNAGPADGAGSAAAAAAGSAAAGAAMPPSEPRPIANQRPRRTAGDRFSLPLTPEERLAGLLSRSPPTRAHWTPGEPLGPGQSYVRVRNRWRSVTDLAALLGVGQEADEEDEEDEDEEEEDEEEEEGEDEEDDLGHALLSLGGGLGLGDEAAFEEDLLGQLLDAEEEGAAAAAAAVAAAPQPERSPGQRRRRRHVPAPAAGRDPVGHGGAVPFLRWKRSSRGWGTFIPRDVYIRVAPIRVGINENSSSITGGAVLQQLGLCMAVADPARYLSTCRLLLAIFPAVYTEYGQRVVGSVERELFNILEELCAHSRTSGRVHTAALYQLLRTVNKCLKLCRSGSAKYRTSRMQSIQQAFISLPKCDAHDVPPADGSSLIDLPDDVVHMILTHLSTPADIAATAQTCKRLAAFCADPILWRTLAFLSFPAEQVKEEERMRTALVAQDGSEENKLRVPWRQIYFHCLHDKIRGQDDPLALCRACNMLFWSSSGHQPDRPTQLCPAVQTVSSEDFLRRFPF